MIKIYNLNSSSKEDLERIKLRALVDISNVKKTVLEIIEKVKREGDSALVSYTREFDDKEFQLSKLVVTKDEIEDAYCRVSPDIIKQIKDQVALSNAFHLAQKRRVVDWEEEIEPGILVGEKWTAISEVGLYVPGGKNPFPTVQQILAVPAKIAGCSRIVSCISPKGENLEVLIAANEVGIKEIYRVSGAQAIAALAYGTETIKAVDLITGPGSPYVTAAKIIAQEKVAIDMPAGPSEAIILCDSKIHPGLDLETKAKFIAADILARAEHGPDSAGVCVTDSESLAKMIQTQVALQAKSRARVGYIQEALVTYSAIVVCSSMEEAIEFTNEYAPEHLEVLTENPRDILKKIENAGSVFLGYFNPVAAGDYATGINHILPTGAWAKRTSAVSVWTFMKRVQFSELTLSGLKRLKPIVDTIADVEGLDAHKYSVDVRFE